ncbi:MAG: hypothetical protein WCA37_02325 [Terracidiphilus sp.]
MRVLKVCCTTLLAVASLLSVATAQSLGKATLSRITLKGTSILGASTATHNTVTVQGEMPNIDLVTARKHSVSNTTTASPTALSVPMPRLNAISTGSPSVNFAGLTTVDNAIANGSVVTPPDQGLCAGHGYVMEAINSTLAVYSSSGARLTTPEGVSTFFSLDPGVNPILSDPRCYYDAPTQRWFVSMINVLNFNTGRSNIALAVSQTSDPTGAFNIYSIDTTDDGLNGTPANPGCNASDPCFGDQPTLGADANGIYLTTNEFGLFANVFNGAQVYAISKSGLESGSLPPVVHIGNLPLAEGPAYSIQPASSPDLSSEQAPGVEYFLSALDFTGSLDNRIAVWALSNTSSLDSASPAVTLTSQILQSEVYGQPYPVTQKPGPYPLGQALGEPEEYIDSGDDRMQNVVYSSGHLWGGLNTIVSDGTNFNTGIAYFVVNPSMSGSSVSGKLQGQGYVSVAGNSVLYPGTAVTADGTAAVSFTVAGPGYYPSAAYAHVTPSHATGVQIVAAGAGPQDDFSGYPEFGGGGVARWGDYSWGVADGSSLWFATELIPGGISGANFYTDFGTQVFSVNLH